MTSRINEKQIYGALLTYADTNISGVTFYESETEPAITGASAWCMFEIEYTEQETSRESWMAEGRLTAYISSRKSGGNVFAARHISHQLSDKFIKVGVPITISSSTIGYIKFKVPSTHSLGEADGILNHWWSCEFFVNSVT